MKKVLAIILVLTMVFTFTSCANSSNMKNSDKTQNEIQDNPSADQSLGLSQSEWDAAVQSQRFENVTFTYNATFSSGYDDVGPHVGTYKLTKNGMLMDGRLASAEEKTALKTMFIDTATAIVNNFNQFQYNEKSNNYTAKESIQYNTMILEYETTIIGDDVLVIFDKDNNLSMISCKMTQKFKHGNSNLTTYVLDVELTFTDYGTTTLEY